MSDDEFEEAHENGGEPVALDINGEACFVHPCFVESPEGDEIPIVDLTLVESLGRCDMDCEHFNTITFMLTPAEANKLAASLLNASDAIVAPELAETPDE